MIKKTNKNTNDLVIVLPSPNPNTKITKIVWAEYH